MTVEASLPYITSGEWGILASPETNARYRAELIYLCDREYNRPDPEHLVDLVCKTLDLSEYQVKHVWASFWQLVSEQRLRRDSSNNVWVVWGR